MSLGWRVHLRPDQGDGWLRRGPTIGANLVEAGAAEPSSRFPRHVHEHFCDGANSFHLRCEPALSPLRLAFPTHRSIGRSGHGVPAPRPDASLAESYLSSRTTGPDTGSVTPRPPP